MKAGWQQFRLGDVCRFDKVQGVHSELPYVGLEHIESDTAQFLGTLEPTEVKSSTFRFTDEHVLYGRLRPYLNKVLTPDFSGHCSTEIFPIAPGSRLNRQYLRYWFQSGATVQRINETCTGARMPRADMNAVLDFAIPLPPLPEQQRIVAILDETCAGIATARAAAEHNRQSARALFESQLQAVFSQRGEGWTEKHLGEFAVFRNGINFNKSSKGDAIKILGVRDFQNHYWAPLDELELIVPDGVVPEADTLRANDLVFVRSNGNLELIGRCVLVGEVDERITHSGFTIKARLQTTEVLPTYLCHFLKSDTARRAMVDGGNGANIKSLNQGALANLIIPFPLRTEKQADIVRQIEAFHEKAQRLAAIYQRKLEALNELKQSLLHRAFNGDLTPRTMDYPLPKAA